MIKRNNHTLFFDIGNVLIFFSHQKLEMNLIQICNLELNLPLNNPLFVDYELGKITTKELYSILHSRSKKSFSLDQFIHAITDIFVPNEAILPLLANLKKMGHRLILLSNTCEAHFEYLKKHYPHFQFFEDRILSYEVTLRKPDPRIYELALSKSEGLTFYTDDIPEYVEVAKKSGLDGLPFTDLQSLEHALKSKGFLASLN